MINLAISLGATNVILVFILYLVAQHVIQFRRNQTFQMLELQLETPEGRAERSTYIVRNGDLSVLVAAVLHLYRRGDLDPVIKQRLGKLLGMSSHHLTPKKP